MKAVVPVLAAALGLAAAAAPAAAASAKYKATAFGCASFMADFLKASTGHEASFERPLTITRGFLDDEDGIEVHVLQTREDVEGTLKCRGDQFRRFEVRVRTPVADNVATAYTAFEEAALVAAFHWDRAKVQTIVKAMAADADEYLKASIQRGDTFQAGKVEYHQGDTLDLGTIWTTSDRTFILAAQSED